MKKKGRRIFMDLFQTAGTGHCAGGYCVPTGCIRADKTGQGGQALHVASHIQVAFGCDSKTFLFLHRRCCARNDEDVCTAQCTPHVTHLFGQRHLLTSSCQAGTPSGLKLLTFCQSSLYDQYYTNTRCTSYPRS